MQSMNDGLGVRDYQLPVPVAGAGAAVKLIRVRAPEDLYMPRLLQNFGLRGFETASLSCILAICQSMGSYGDKAFYDVGANMGVYSFLVASCFPGKFRIHAFEPFDGTRAVARSIAEDNGLDYQVHDEAVDEVDGTATFFLSKVSDTSHSLLKNPAKMSGVETAVRTVCLDTLRARDGTELGLIKLDTEGTEPNVIRGGRASIQRDRPHILVEVLTDGAGEQIRQTLEGLEYQFYRISDDGGWHPDSRIAANEDRNWLLAPGPL